MEIECGWAGLENAADLRLRKRGVLLCAGLWLLVAGPPRHACVAAAQEQTATAGSDTAQNPEGNKPAQDATSSSMENKTGEKSIETDRDKEKKEHRGAIVVAPLPLVSPAIGAGAVPVLGYIFPLQEKDKTAPRW